MPIVYKIDVDCQKVINLSRKLFDHEKDNISNRFNCYRYRFRIFNVRQHYGAGSF